MGRGFNRSRPSPAALLVLIGALLLAACTLPPLPESSAPVPVDAGEFEAADVAVLPAEDDGFVAEEVVVDAEPAERTLTVIYTNDEHGWLEGMAPGQGAAELVGVWRDALGYDPDDDAFIVLSGGDMWTGPAVSTWFGGESMAEVLNVMGYDAAAVGNHEFDFGLDTLAERAAQSTFPFVSANIRDKTTGETPAAYGIEPYVIREHAGVAVGIIGLTTQTTPRSTNPANVRDFDFIDYADALRDVVPQARADGAELILVPAHICAEEMIDLTVVAAELGVSLLGGGHCNESVARTVRGVVTLIGGFHLNGAAYATLTVDTATGNVSVGETGLLDNVGGAAEPAVAAVVEKWSAAADEALNTPIGYLAEPVMRRSAAMRDLTTHSWLWAVPSADIAATNLGGMRAALPAGDVTLGDIIGVMPFDNVLVEVEMTGAQFQAILGDRSDSLAIAGAYRDGARWVLSADGTPLTDAVTVRVLVNDFMYAGGDGFDALARVDPDAYNTAIDWRQPVIDWIIAADSSPASPLDPAIAALSNTR